MRSCIVLGSGRSGTSMAAGLFRNSGYFMGDRPMPVRTANPRGFFEDLDVNEINEALLARVVKPRRGGVLALLPGMRSRPAFAQRWLAEVPLSVRCDSTPQLRTQIRDLVARSPYCLKDPRFCYTLPAWRPLLDDPVYLCVFRDPARTAESIVREAREAEYLRGLQLDRDRALRVWELMYGHVLQHHRHVGDWLFVHYDQVLDNSAVDVIEQVVGAPLDRTFPDQRVSRSRSGRSVPDSVAKVYAQLLELSRSSLG